MRPPPPPPEVDGPAARARQLAVGALVVLGVLALSPVPPPPDPNALCTWDPVTQAALAQLAGWMHPHGLPIAAGAAVVAVGLCLPGLGRRGRGHA